MSTNFQLKRDQWSTKIFHTGFPVMIIEIKSDGTDEVIGLPWIEQNGKHQYLIAKTAREMGKWYFSEGKKLITAK